MFEVQVERVLPDPGETLWRAEGFRTDTGEPVRFVGDWRPMRELWAAVEHALDDEPIVADVPEWAVI